jgi:hypothetical protein
MVKHHWYARIAHGPLKAVALLGQVDRAFCGCPLQKGPGGAVDQLIGAASNPIPPNESDARFARAPIRTTPQHMTATAISDIHFMPSLWLPSIGRERWTGLAPSPRLHIIGAGKEALRKKAYWPTPTVIDWIAFTITTIPTTRMQRTKRDPRQSGPGASTGLSSRIRGTRYVPRIARTGTQKPHTRRERRTA